MRRALVALLLAAPAAAQPVDVADISRSIADEAQTRAERACLVNIDSRRRVETEASIWAWLRTFTLGRSRTEETRIYRGAARDLQDRTRLIENDALRACIEQRTSTWIAHLWSLQPDAVRDAAEPVPNPIRFQFTYERRASADRTRWGEALMLNLAGLRQPLHKRILATSAQSQFFDELIPYPPAGRRWVGVIAPEPAGSVLTTETPPLLRLCLERPRTLPAQRHEHDQFVCTEGEGCRPAPGMATGWLSLCEPPAAARAAAWRLARRLVETPARAQSGLHWRVPSARTLAEQPAEGVGWTMFTVETDAFRAVQPAGVEVALAVNGVPVLEDGLPAALRPVPADPDGGFAHVFALETLNFTGAEGGCDRVEVTLTPLDTEGRRGRPLRAAIPYVALRDLEEGQAGGVRWRARFVTPVREWRHIAFVGSYSVAMTDPASIARARAWAGRDRAWIDRQGWTFRGQKIVGVVRPPLRVTEKGTGFYGLAIGLVQPSGQVRFTHSQADARALGQHMLSLRSSAEARRIIRPEPYLYQASNRPPRTTPAGVCALA